MTGMWSIKEMIQCATLGIPKETKKNAIFFLLRFALTFWSEMKYNFRGMQNRKPFEIILHVGRVTSLQSWVAKKLCHSQTLINECYISDCLSNFQGLYLVLHAILFQTVFCFPYKLIPISIKAVSWNTSEAINENNTSAFNYRDYFKLGHNFWNFEPRWTKKVVCLGNLTVSHVKVWLIHDFVQKLFCGGPQCCLYQPVQLSGWSGWWKWRSQYDLGWLFETARAEV